MPKKFRPRRNISRIDQYKKRQHGWWVRVMRNGFTYQKFFSDYASGGKIASLREAKDYRDELLEKYPPSPTGNVFNKITARNTSGYPGISKSGSYRKGHYYESWQACWIEKPGGKRVCRKFVFSESGRTELAAKRLAIKTRREAIEKLKHQ